MQSLVRLSALALFATAGFGWWQSAQLPKSDASTDYTAEEIQSSLAELMPDVNFESDAYRLEAVADSALNSVASSDLGDAELFSGVPKGIPVPVLGENSKSELGVQDSEAVTATPTNAGNNGIFESYFNDDQQVTQSSLPKDKTGSETATADDIEVEEITTSVDDSPIAQTETEVRNTDDPEVDSEETNSEDPTSTVVFGSSRELPAEESEAVGEQETIAEEKTNSTSKAKKNVVPVAARKNAVVRWDQSYRTTTGRPFEFKSIGNGGQKVMVIGSLYGTEQEAAPIMDRLLHNLTKNMDRYPDTQILLIRTGNPDGRSYRVAGNVRGVLLDRNFLPSGNVKQVGTAQVRPELETLTLLKLMNDFKPKRVVHVRTTTEKTGRIQFTSQDEAIAAFFQDFGEFTIDNSTRNQTRTSLAGFVSQTMKRDVVTVMMPVSQDVNSSWMKHRQTLLSVLEELKPPHHSAPLKEKSEIDLNEGPFAEGPENDSSDVVPFGESRVFDELDPTLETPEVEFLPPPPQASLLDETVDTAVVDELPPPPDKK